MQAGFNYFLIWYCENESAMNRLSLLLVSCLVSAALTAQETLTLLFAGDLMQHSGQIEAARQADGTYDYSGCFDHVADEIRSADIAVGNLEVTMGGPPYRGYPAFCAPDEYLLAIRDAGFDVLLTANNHCLDTGCRGLERTVRLLDSLSIPHAGTYLDEADRLRRYPLLVRKNGFSVVLLNYTYGTNGIPVCSPAAVNLIDRAVMAEDISRARAMRPDVIIAYVHWGIEYSRRPSAEQRELASWLLAQGVDHVVGTHPHVAQPMELLPHPLHPGHGVVAYSLGNFISNMSARHTDGGVMLRLQLVRRFGITRLDNCRYSLVWTSRPVLSGRSNYVLYPVGIDPELLNAGELGRMRRFVEDTRSFFDRCNIGIEEYLCK